MRMPHMDPILVSAPYTTGIKYRANTATGGDGGDPHLLLLRGQPPYSCVCAVRGLGYHYDGLSLQSWYCISSGVGMVYGGVPQPQPATTGKRAQDGLLWKPRSATILVLCLKVEPLAQLCVLRCRPAFAACVRCATACARSTPSQRCGLGWWGVLRLAQEGAGRAGLQVRRWDKVTCLCRWGARQLTCAAVRRMASHAAAFFSGARRCTWPPHFARPW